MLKNYQFRISAATKCLEMAKPSLPLDSDVAWPTIVTDGQQVDVVLRYDDASLADLQASMAAVGAVYVGEVIP